MAVVKHSPTGPVLRSDDMNYAIVLVPGPLNWGAFSPNVPGCVAIGDSAEEALASFTEALEVHLDDLRGQGLPIPSEYVSPNEQEDSNGFYLPWAEVNATIKV